MNDEDLRELERKWKVSGDEMDAIRLLNAQIHSGIVSASAILACTHEHNAIARERARAARELELATNAELQRQIARAYMPRTHFFHRSYQVPVGERRWTDHACASHESIDDDTQWNDWQVVAQPDGTRGWSRRCRFCPLRRFSISGCPSCPHPFHVRAPCVARIEGLVLLAGGACGCTGPPERR